MSTVAKSCTVLGVLFLVFVIYVSQQISKMPDPGDTLVLTSTTLAVTEEARDLMLETIFEKDKIGFGNLLEAGLLFRVPDGTEAQFLRSENVEYNTFYRVRITDGPHFGQAGWVQEKKTTFISTRRQ